MRILQLANSDAGHTTGVAEGERSYRIVQRMLAEASGEDVETVLRVIWPSPDLPDIVDRWMDRYAPDVVVFHMNGYWYLYQSVPLKLERKLGRWGRPLTGVGFGMGRNRIAETTLFQRIRTLLVRTVGGAYYFTPKEVIDTVDACVRRILAREGTTLMVRGNLLGWSEGAHGAEAEVHRAVSRLAAELHFTFLARDPREPVAGQDLYQSGDRLHASGAVHLLFGEREGQALVQAWNHAHGENAAAAVLTSR